MKYLEKKFSAPAGGDQIVHWRWDMAMLSAEEFMRKYDVPRNVYEAWKERGEFARGGRVENAKRGIAGEHRCG